VYFEAAKEKMKVIIRSSGNVIYREVYRSRECDMGGGEELTMLLSGFTCISRITKTCM